MHFAASLPRVDSETKLDGSPQQYGPNGVTTRSPVVKAALDVLNARWPWTLSYLELVNSACAQLNSAGIDVPVDMESTVDELLEQLVLGGVARFRLDTASRSPSPMPRLDDEIRRTAEVACDEGQLHAFNLWHETVWLSVVDLHVLPLLGGTRDREALVDELLSFVRDGLITFDAEAGGAELQVAAGNYVDGLPKRLTEMKLIRLEEPNAISAS